jgi:hypothetical protein
MRRRCWLYSSTWRSRLLFRRFQMSSKRSVLVIAQLLRTLNQEYKAGRLTKVRTSGALQDLARCVCSMYLMFADSTLTFFCRLLEEILVFVQKHTAQGFLKSLYTKGDRITQIDAYHRRLAFSIDSFQARLAVYHDFCIITQLIIDLDRFHLSSTSKIGSRKMNSRGHQINKHWTKDWPISKETRTTCWRHWVCCSQTLQS